MTFLSSSFAVSLGSSGSSSSEVGTSNLLLAIGEGDPSVMRSLDGASYVRDPEFVFSLSGALMITTDE